jgi:hypothetical protein
MQAAVPFESTTLTLAPREVRAIDDPSAVRIACREGALWITLDNDPRDWVVEAGETFEAPLQARALLYALGPTRVDLVALQSRNETMVTFTRFHAMPLMKAAR